MNRWSLLRASLGLPEEVRAAPRAKVVLHGRKAALAVLAGEGLADAAEPLGRLATPVDLLREVVEKKELDKAGVIEGKIKAALDEFSTTFAA